MHETHVKPHQTEHAVQTLHILLTTLVFFQSLELNEIIHVLRIRFKAFHHTSAARLIVPEGSKEVFFLHFFWSLTLYGVLYCTIVGKDVDK